MILISFKKGIDKYYWKIHSKITLIVYIKFKFQRSLSNFTQMIFSRFAWSLDLNFFLIKLVDKYQRKIHLGIEFNSRRGLGGGKSMQLEFNIHPCDTQFVYHLQGVQMTKRKAYICIFVWLLNLNFCQFSPFSS